MLALLQRDGRLIDFLAEDISAYPDAQLGAAVRKIHETCRQVLDHYVKLEPIMNSEEDQPVTVQAGFDPAAIKLIGNVAGEPPMRGLLRHKGWRVKEVNLPRCRKAPVGWWLRRLRSSFRNGIPLGERGWGSEGDSLAAKYIVGIDLGTTNSALARCDATVAEEESRIEVRSIPQLVNPNEVAERTLAAVLSLHPGRIRFS